MLDQHGGGVGVVVLHRHHRQVEPLDETAGGEIRVQVVRDEHRRDIQQRQQMVRRLIEEPQRGSIVQRADVLRQHRLGAAGGAGRGLQHAAERQHRRHRAGQRDGAGREAAGPAQEARGGIDQAHHAVVAAGDHRTVVRDDQVGDAGKAHAGVVILDHQRLAARVGAGGDQEEGVLRRQPIRAGGTAGGFVEQEKMQRRGRQHDAERVEARRQSRRQGALHAPFHQHDGALDQFSDDVASRDAGPAASARRVQRHHRERLAAALLARAQRFDRVGIAGVAQQVEAAEPLQGDDPPARSAASTSASSCDRCGPHAGQAIGSAWKRRSAGSAYSRAQSAQSANGAIAVLARSYGSRRAMVKRGPQCVQLRNG